jgi:hypothetical protein
LTSVNLPSFERRVELGTSVSVRNPHFKNMKNETNFKINYDSSGLLIATPKSSYDNVNIIGKAGRFANN